MRINPTRFERLNRTLQETSASILVDAQKPSELWGEALFTTKYVRNPCPTSTSGQTPDWRMFGSVPDVSRMKVFGAECFVLVPKQEGTGNFASVCAEENFLRNEEKG
jgi:hypothetical protein